MNKVGEPWVQQKMTMKIQLVVNAQSYLGELPLVARAVDSVSPRGIRRGLADGALSASALAQRSTSQLFPPKLDDVNTSKIDWAGVILVGDNDAHPSGGQ